MTEIKKDNKWVKGEQSPNPNGAPAKRKRQRKSELRKLGAKLATMEDKSLKNIEDAINGIEVDKQALDSSKWCITSIVSISKTASSEEQGWIRAQKEMLTMDKMDSDESEQSPEQIESEMPKRLSLVYNASENDE